MGRKKISVNRETDAFVGVDIQRTFCPFPCGNKDCEVHRNLGYGELPVPGGNEVIDPTNAAMRFFYIVVLTFDSHTEKHCSFEEQNGPFPRHGVEGTEGWKSHEELNVRNRETIQIRKAFEDDVEEHCGFCGEPNLHEELWVQRGIRRIFFSGLATDICVLKTVKHARDMGYEVYVLEDAIRGVDDAAIKKALKEMKDRGVTFIRSTDLVAA